MAQQPIKIPRDAPPGVLVLDPNICVMIAGLGPVLTFAITYIMAGSEGHISWEHGVTLSQSIAWAPERFVGTFLLALCCFACFFAVLMRKLFCDRVLGQGRQNQGGFASAVVGTLGTLGVASVQCSNNHWMPAVEYQCAIHFTSAYMCFFGFVGYILHQTFVLDPRLAEALPGYKVPIAKKCLTVLPLVSLAAMMSGVWRPDLFEILMILGALLWMCTLHGTFDGMKITLQFANQASGNEEEADVREGLREGLVV